MGRGERDSARHLGGVRHGIRERNDNPCDPGHLEDDPCRDIRDPSEEQSDPTMDDYLWPEYVEEDDD